MTKNKTILRIDSSARKTGSATRALNDKLIAVLAQPQETKTISRDVTEGVGFLTEKWVEGTFTPVEKRSNEHKAALSESDILVDELMEADVIVIGAPVYNFSIGASLKAWVDMVARAGVTFSYTENGPVGKLTGKKAFITFASGGTKLDSEFDFASGYLKHFLGFIGITDVTFISSDDEIAQISDKLSNAA